MQGDWNANIGEDADENWIGTCGRYCNTKLNERGLRLLEFATHNDLMLANTFGPHQTPRRATWHSPNGKYHNQIDYIMVRKRFRSSVNIVKTRGFAGADIGSDHELVMMTFKRHLKRVKKLGHARIKFDLEKLKDPEVAKAFAALTILDDDGTDMETLINTFNTAVTNTASEILGKHRPVKKPWVTADLLDLCDKRRELKKKKKKDAEGVKQHRAANQEIKKGMKKAKMNWIEEQCQDIEDSMKMNSSKKTYQLVKDLTSTKQGRTTTIQDKDGKCLTEEQDILKRWSEYCSELYNYRATGDPEVLNIPPANDNDNYPILREEVEAAVKSLKKGKSAGAGRRRSNDMCPTDYLQRDLADMGVAHAVDPISHHHPPQERQPTAMPELSYHQPHQPPEQSYAENLAEPTEAASGKDHR